HIPPHAHARFYSRQRATLNITRAQMRRLGWSPSVRLFEAAACATPIISDRWAGLDHFFEPDREIFLVDSADDVIRVLRDLPADALQAAGRAARDKVLAAHTADHRALQLEEYYQEVLS